MSVASFCRQLSATLCTSKHYILSGWEIRYGSCNNPWTSTSARSIKKWVSVMVPIHRWLPSERHTPTEAHWGAAVNESPLLCTHPLPLFRPQKNNHLHQFYLTTFLQRLCWQKTGVFFRLLPNKMMCFKGDMCHGGKQSKECSVVVLTVGPLPSEHIMTVLQRHTE